MHLEVWKERQEGPERGLAKAGVPSGCVRPADVADVLSRVLSRVQDQPQYSIKQTPVPSQQAPPHRTASTSHPPPVPMSSTDAGSERLLGPPILKLPQCPLHVPEAWRSALLEHLDGKARVVVAQTSKAGLQWVLQEWPNATLTFLVGPASSSERPTEDTLRRALAARQQLSVRGDRPTVLQLKHEGDGTTRHETWWHIAFSALGSRDPVPNLALSLQLPHMSRNLLSFAGTAFRGLNKLSLGAPGTSIDAQMPLSARLPALRHLVVHAVLGSSQAKFWESVAPYMTRLVRPHGMAFNRTAGML